MRTAVTTSFLTTETAVGADGDPVWIVCPDPRAFALHKLWISERQDRDPLQHRRDWDALPESLRRMTDTVAEQADFKKHGPSGLNRKPNW